MKITRNDKTLTVRLSSGIGCDLVFTYTAAGNSWDAEAWRVHLQNAQDRDEKYRENSLRWRDDEIKTLARSNAALRGVITKLKAEEGKP